MNFYSMEWEVVDDVEDGGHFLITTLYPSSIPKDLDGHTKEEFIPILFEFMRGNSPYEYGTAHDLFVQSLSHEELELHNKGELPKNVGISKVDLVRDIGFFDEDELFIYEAKTDDQGVITKLENLWVLPKNWFETLTSWRGYIEAEWVVSAHYERKGEKYD